MSNLANRMLAHSIDACTNSAARRRKHHTPVGTILIWLSIAALVAVYFLLK